jgi:hypothetical protein
MDLFADELIENYAEISEERAINRKLAEQGGIKGETRSHCRIEK